MMSVSSIGTIRRKKAFEQHVVYKGDPMFRLIRNIFILRQAWKMIKRRR